ncbi:hypothetical protein [Mycolicibacter minnesotensis]
MLLGVVLAFAYLDLRIVSSIIAVVLGVAGVGILVQGLVNFARGRR